MILRLLIVLIIAAIAAAVFYSLNSDDGDSPLFKGLAQIKSLSENAKPSAKTETAVYKWRDKSGEWHFSNQPPPEGAAAEITVYRSDTNVVPSAKNPAKEKSAPAPDASTTTPPLLPIADPGQIKQLIDNAKNVQNLMDNRQQQIDSQTETR